MMTKFLKGPILLRESKRWKEDLTGRRDLISSFSYCIIICIIEVQNQFLSCDRLTWRIWYPFQDKIGCKNGCINGLTMHVSFLGWWMKYPGSFSLAGWGSSDIEGKITEILEEFGLNTSQLEIPSQFPTKVFEEGLIGIELFGVNSIVSILVSMIGWDSHHLLYLRSCAQHILTSVTWSKISREPVTLNASLTTTFGCHAYVGYN